MWKGTKNVGWLGIRSGEATPNSHSRPHSSMSQQSACSVGNSIVNLRPRTATPRRPRPASIAGTGVSIPERHSEHGFLPLLKIHLLQKYYSSQEIDLTSLNFVWSIRSCTEWIPHWKSKWVDKSVRKASRK